MRNPFITQLAHALMLASKGKTKAEIVALAERACLMLKHKNLLNRSGEVFAALERERLVSENMALATVETSRPLTPSQRTAMQELAEKKFKKNIELQELVNPDLLGGFKIRSGDTVIDASLRNHLKQLALHLTQ